MGLKSVILITVSLLGNVFTNFISTRPGKNVTLSWTMNTTSVKNVAYLESGHTAIFDLDNLPSVDVYKNTSYTHRVTYNGNVSQQDVGLFSFILRNVSVTDAGTYSCLNSVGGTIENCGITLVVLQTPENPNLTVYPASPTSSRFLKLTCTSRSRSFPLGYPLNISYTWKRNGKTLENDEPNWTVENVTKADRGDKYACQANEEGMTSGWSSIKEIDVHYGPTEVQIEHNTDSVVEDRVLTCSADCNPVCDVTWSDRKGSELTKGYGQADITVTRSMSDINCTARNIIGKVSEHFIAPNIERFSIQDKRHNVTVREGENVTLRCRVKSRPKPEVSFKRRGDIVAQKTRTVIPADNKDTYTFQQVVSGVQCADHGLYSVNAENTIGSATLHSVYLYIKCTPRLYPDNDKTLTFLDKSSSFTTWTFKVLSYPEPSLGEVSFLTDEGTTSVNLHKSSKKIQDNLHQYNVDFPCGSQPGKYQFYFLHEENTTPIVLMLPEHECEVFQSNTADDGLVNVVAVATVSVVIAIILVVAAVVVYRSKKTRVRDQVRHDRFFHNAEPRERDPIRDTYATVKKIPRNKPIACSNRTYRHDANAKEQWSLIGRQNNIRRGEGLNNCGERNVDGLIYADLDLAPPTLIKGRPVIKGKVEETVYGVIDFSQTPGPQLPEKIWEKESP